MWAHYSNGQKGLRFWFDHIELNVRVDGVFDEVKYQERMPEFKIRDLLRDRDDAVEKALRASMQTKSHVWQYEHEYRWIVDKSCREIDKASEMSYVKINIKALKRIDFGIRCKDEIVNKVAKFVKGCELTVELMRAEMDKAEYKLNYRPIAQ